MDDAKPPSYLKPYLDAARRHAGGFKSLLWANPGTQAKRFDAFARLCDFNGKSILDAGCGRADFLDFLLARGIKPDHYVGLEAVKDLATAAERKHHPRCTILRADFVREPARLLVGAEVVIFSGSLNTMETPTFQATLRTAYEAAGRELVFNYLCSPSLAGARYLTWHPANTVMRYARTLCEDVRQLEDYIPGDCTISMRKMVR